MTHDSPTAAQQGVKSASEISQAAAPLLTEYFGIRNKQAKARMSGELGLRLAKPFSPEVPARKQGFEQVVTYLWVNENMAGGTYTFTVGIDLKQSLPHHRGGSIT